MEFKVKVNGVELEVNADMDSMGSMEGCSVFAEDSKIDLWEILSESVQDEICEKVFKGWNDDKYDREPDDTYEPDDAA